jgi:hypothetical protein
MIFKKSPYTFLITIILALPVIGQKNFPPPDEYVLVAASEDFGKSKLHQLFFGKNRRKEWSTPVRVPILLLDNAFEGLVPYEIAGGGETKSLRLKSTAGKEYVLRSIEKWRHGAVPKLLKHTWFASLFHDGVSMSYPYGAFAVPVMLDAANIHHTLPKLVYVPWQNKLDTFNTAYAENLYLLEERLAGDWVNAPHLGSYNKYYNTEEVKDKLLENNEYKADQHSFIKARLFDILISDVDRHGGNWKWGLSETGTSIFHAIPVDRDQAFFTHNGFFSGVAIAFARRRFMQNFDYNIQNVKKLTLTKQDRNLDEFFSNEMAYTDWIRAAKEIQQSLNDAVIIKSIQQLPPEIFTISGTEIIKKLQQRRDKLHEYASQYYYIMAKEVEVNGTKQKEHFEVKRLADKQLVVNVYRLKNNGQKETSPFYTRTFNSKETKHITINGFGGDDMFDVEKGIENIKVEVKPVPKK